MRRLFANTPAAVPSISFKNCSRMHGGYILLFVACVYFGVAHLVTVEAIARPYIHDVIHLEYEGSDIMVNLILGFSILLCWLSKPNWDLLFKRLALSATLKGISQSITIVPQPLGVDECVGVPFWRLKNCADMMFSGHTAFTYLVLYKTRYRYFFAFAMAFELVMAKWHYMSDCFIAFIVGYAIEKYLPVEKLSCIY